MRSNLMMPIADRTKYDRLKRKTSEQQHTLINGIFLSDAETAE